MRLGIKHKQHGLSVNVSRTMYYAGLYELADDWKSHQCNMKQIGCCLLPYGFETAHQVFVTLQGKSFGEAVIINNSTI